MMATTEAPLPAPLTCRNLRARSRPATASRLTRRATSTPSNAIPGASARPTPVNSGGQTRDAMTITPVHDTGHAEELDQAMLSVKARDNHTRAGDANAHPDNATAETRPNALSSFSCPICFTPPTNATLTPCGHVSCGSCLFNAVGIAMKRSEDQLARCPVCRATIEGWDGRGGGVIGLKTRFR